MYPDDTSISYAWKNIGEINTNTNRDLNCEKYVGTIELHYSIKKRENSFGILKAFFVRHSSAHETSDNDRKVN